MQDPSSTELSYIMSACQNGPTEDLIQNARALIIKSQVLVIFHTVFTKFAKVLASWVKSDYLWRVSNPWKGSPWGKLPFKPTSKIKKKELPVD